MVGAVATSAPAMFNKVVRGRKKRRKKDEQEEKELSAHKGNKVNQGGTFPFIENFNTWRETRQGISGDEMMVKNIPNLYAFLKAHDE